MAGLQNIQPSKTLVNIPKYHLQWQFTSGQQSWTSRNYAKGHQDKQTGRTIHHGKNPTTSGTISRRTCEQSQQIQRRPNQTSITTHIAKDAKPRDHQQHQKRIQKTTLRNEAYADVRRERRSHNFNNGGTQESRLRSKMTKRSLSDGGTQESRQTRQAPKLISRQRRNTGIAFTEKSNNGEGTLKANIFQDKIKEKQEDKEHQDDE